MWNLPPVAYRAYAPKTIGKYTVWNHCTKFGALIVVGLLLAGVITSDHLARGQGLLVMPRWLVMLMSPTLGYYLKQLK